MLYRYIKNIFSRVYHSIQTLIALSFSCLILIIIGAIGFTSYQMTGNVIEKNSEDYVYQLMEQVNNNISYYVDDVKTIYRNISYNPDVYNYLQGNYEDKTEAQQQVSQYLNTFIVSRKDLLNIFIFRADDDLVANVFDIELNPHVNYKKSRWYLDALQSDEIVISESRVQNIIKEQYKWVISFSGALNNYNNKENLGVVLIDLNFNIIEDMVSKITLGKKGYVFIIDSQGNIIYHPKQQLIYSGLLEEPIELILDSPDGNIIASEGRDKKQYTITTTASSDWKVVGAVYIDDIYGYRVVLRRFFLVLGFVSLVVAIFFAIIISRQILYPIKDLAKAMNKFKEKGSDVHIDIKKNNEIGQLGQTFNLMVQEINKLMRQNHLEQEQKRKSELKALQAQINPHFLYNTLDSIVWMAEAKNYERVTEMTSALAKLFRISISKGEEFISIKKEIEHVKNYLKIQKMRYAKKLDYHIEIDENILEYKTIKLILQPIVENAIYHGIKMKPDLGKIEIIGEEIDDKILFQIKDNGVGIEEEIIDQLLGKATAGGNTISAHQNRKETKLGGVGIGNVDERIKLYYGDEYGVEIESELYEGTLVKVWIPKQLDEGS